MSLHTRRSSDLHYDFFVFFFTNRRQLRSTLFPYTTLFRSQGTNLEQIQQLGAQVQQILSGLSQVRSVFAERVRSEEHTSELQSRENLVCRLLLEKKKMPRRDITDSPRHAVSHLRHCLLRGV